MTEHGWTREEKLLGLMRLPWDIRITTEEDGTLFARVGEIRDAVADGRDDRELGAELWASLYESLAIRLDRGDAIPLPTGHALPWDAAAQPPRPRERTTVMAELVKDAFQRHAEPAAAAGDFQLVGA